MVEWMAPVLTVLGTCVTTMGIAFVAHMRSRTFIIATHEKTRAEVAEKVRISEQEERAIFRAELFRELDRLRVRIGEQEQKLLACEMDKLDLHRRIGLNELKIAKLETGAPTQSTTQSTTTTSSTSSTAPKVIVVGVSVPPEATKEE